MDKLSLLDVNKPEKLKKSLDDMANYINNSHYENLAKTNSSNTFSAKQTFESDVEINGNIIQRGNSYITNT